MESFDVAVAFRVMIRRPPMGDAEPVERLDEPRRSELCPIVCGHRQASLAAALGQPFDHNLGRKGKWVYFRAIYGRCHKADRKAKRVMLNEFCPTHA